MIEEMNNIPKEDDGSLAFLNIPEMKTAGVSIVMKRHNQNS